jgi:hypothetical protein
MDQVNYKVGYAKSARASCKLCKKSLPLGALRLGTPNR